MTLRSPRLDSLIACLIGALMLLPGAAPASADTSAMDFVTSIYRTYVGKDARGVPLDSRRAREASRPA